MRPLFSSMICSTRRSTRASRPQYGTISPSNDMPRLALCVSSVLTISSLLFTRTSSPGCRLRVSNGVLFSVALDERVPSPVFDPQRSGQNSPAKALVLVEQTDADGAESGECTGIARADVLKVLPGVPGRDPLRRRPQQLGRLTGVPPLAEGGGVTGPARGSRERRQRAAWRRTRHSVQCRFPGRDPLQPRLLPIDAAARLTASVRLAVTAGHLQVHGISDAVHTCRFDGVAKLQGELLDPEPLPTPSEHLGHERKAVQLAVLVERRQYLSLAAHLDDLADAQVERLSHGHLLGLHCYTPV